MLFPLGPTLLSFSPTFLVSFFLLASIEIVFLLSTRCMALLQLNFIKQQTKLATIDRFPSDSSVIVIVIALVVVVIVVVAAATVCAASKNDKQEKRFGSDLIMPGL